MEGISHFQIAGKIANSRFFIKKNFFVPKSDPLNYFRYRIIRPFLKGYNLLLTRNKVNTLWMAPAAIRIFENLLTKEMTGLEFGSGRSTLFFAQRIKHLVSLEHDRSWYDKVRQEITELQLNIDYFLIEPLTDTTKKFNYPTSAYSNILFPHTPATCYEMYYSFVDRYPDNHFDFIVVDGRARTECALRSIRKIKEGGFIVLDNAERYRYQQVHEKLASWKKIFTTTGLTDTVFWFKE